MTDEKQFEYTPRVAFLPAALDACALYRMFIPHLNIPYSTFIFKGGHVPISEFAECSVVVVQRQASIHNYNAMLSLRSKGMKVVYDIDDDIWNVPRYNPNFEIFKHAREAFSNCAKLADLITVSTKTLKKAVQNEIPQMADRVVIAPNAVDYRLFQPTTVSRNDQRVVIGWAGSNTHDADIVDCWEMLPDIVEQNEHVWLEIVGGAQVPKRLEGHPRVKFREWCPVSEFPVRFASWGWDIVLAPLEDYRFNRSKSNIKILEATAINAVALVSGCGPYAEFCALDDELKFLQVHFKSQWKSKLQELVNNPAGREYYAGRLRAVAEEHYSIDKIKAIWQYQFRKLCQS